MSTRAKRSQASCGGSMTVQTGGFVFRTEKAASHMRIFCVFFFSALCAMSARSEETFFTVLTPAEHSWPGWNPSALGTFTVEGDMMTISITSVGRDVTNLSLGGLVEGEFLDWKSILGPATVESYMIISPEGLPEIVTFWGYKATWQMPPEAMSALQAGELHLRGTLDVWGEFTVFTNRLFPAAEIPEPGAIALGLGGVVLGFAAWRRRRARQSAEFQGD